MSSDDALEPLIQRAVQGDEAAIESLLLHHHHDILQYIERKFPPPLRSFIEPQDVLQDTYFEACRIMSGFEYQGDRSFFRWLATIARHRMIDLLRMHRARGSTAGNGLASDDSREAVAALEELAVYRRTPSKSATSREVLAAIEAAIDRLPKDYQQAIRLRHLDGFTVSETAEKMARPNNAVYVLCCRGLQMLRSELRTIDLSSLPR